MQCNRVRNLSQREIRRVCTSLDTEIIQRPLEIPCRRKPLLQTLYSDKLIAFEMVGLSHRRAPWRVAAPRPEYTRGNDFSSRHCIGKSSGKFRRPIKTQSLEFKMMQAKCQRRFTGLCSQ